MINISKINGFDVTKSSGKFAGVEKQSKLKLGGFNILGVPTPTRAFKFGRLNNIKGFTYQIDQSKSVFSFSSEVGENTRVWFKKYTTPSAFQASIARFGGSSSWLSTPNPILSPNTAEIDPEPGAKLSVHQIPDGTIADTWDTGAPSGTMEGGTFDGKYLCIGQQSGLVYRFDPLTGEQRDIIDLQFGTGTGGVDDITWDGKYYWGYACNIGHIYQFDKAGNKVSSFPNPINGVQAFDAMTWDGSYLWAGHRESSYMYKFKTDGTMIPQWSMPPGLLDNEGATFDGVYLWISDETTDAVYQVTKDGQIVSGFSHPAGDYPEGGMWDGKYLYFVDFYNSMVYKYTGSSNFDISYKIGRIK